MISNLPSLVSNRSPRVDQLAESRTSGSRSSGRLPPMIQLKAWVIATTMTATPSPGSREAGRAWLTQAAAREGWALTPRPGHLLWGMDPRSGAWEALALLTPPSGKGTALLVRLFQVRVGRWRWQRVGSAEVDLDLPGHLRALAARDLFEWGGCPTLRRGQDPRVPAAPIEFHFEPDDEGTGLASPAEVFHPVHGLAIVVNTVVDDRKDPAPPGQTWATHGRGESTDLPLSAFNHGARVVDRWAGRVWFRLDGQLYAICKSEWKAPWPKVEPSSRGRE